MLRLHHITPSMSRPANPYDNAFCESFMRTLKREEIDARAYRDLDDLRAHVQEFIEQYYNRCRLHSALGLPATGGVRAGGCNQPGWRLWRGQHEFFKAWGNLSMGWGDGKDRLPGSSDR